MTDGSELNVEMISVKIGNDAVYEKYFRRVGG